MQMNDGVIKLSNTSGGEGVVHIEGQETITGSKTFSANTYIGSVGEPADLGIVGDLNIQGDIIQNGSAYETHAEKIYTKNDYITLRDGAESGLLSGDYSGFQVEKYDGTNDGRLVIDNTGTARVGDVGDEQPLLTRDESASLTDDGLLIWDSANSKAVNFSTITADALGNLTATSFNGTLNGNATSATKATNDGADNNIVNTYANRLIGNVSDNTEVYNKLEEDCHSTFDINKFTKVGNPTITRDGIASGFSGGNYISLSTRINVTDTSYEIDIPFVKTANSTVIASTTISISGNQSFALIHANNHLMLFLGTGIGSDWNISGSSATGTTNCQNNVQYIAKFIRTSTQYLVNLLNVETGVETTEITVNSTTDLGDLSILYLGTPSYWSSIAYNTIYDLKQFSISVDGVPVFSGNQTGIDTVKPDDYTVVDSPTISADGVITNWNNSNRVVYKTINGGGSTNYEIHYRLLIPQHKYTEDNLYTQPLYLSNSGDNNWHFQLYTQNINQLMAFGTGFNYINVGVSSSIMQTIDYIDFVLKNDGTALTCKSYKPDGTLITTVTSTTSYSQLPFESLTLYTNNNSYFTTGTPLYQIDMNCMKVIVDGNLVYQPCLKIPYTLSSTNDKIVDMYYLDRVQDATDYLGYNNYALIDETDKEFIIPQGFNFNKLYNIQSMLGDIETLLSEV